MYYPLSFCVPHAFDYWGINILANSMVLCNTGHSMEKVLVPRWPRIYGLFGLPWSRKLYVVHHFFLYLCSLYRTVLMLVKFEQWEQICKLVQITDMRYTFRSLLNHAIFTLASNISCIMQTKTNYFAPFCHFFNLLIYSSSGWPWLASSSR